MSEQSRRRFIQVWGNYGPHLPPGNSNPPMALDTLTPEFVAEPNRFIEAPSIPPNASPPEPLVWRVGIGIVITLISLEIDKWLEARKREMIGNRTAQEILGMIDDWQQIEPMLCPYPEPQLQSVPPPVRPAVKRKKRKSGEQRWRVYGYSRAKKGRRL